MKTVFTKEELKSELTELKEKRAAVYQHRKGLLQKFSAKNGSATPNKATGELHDLDRKIEDIERKINILF